MELDEFFHLYSRSSFQSADLFALRFAHFVSTTTDSHPRETRGPRCFKNLDSRGNFQEKPPRTLSAEQFPRR